jgi:geranylgeranyl pyrophosphate synthase
MELSSGQLQEYCQAFNWRQSRKDYEERIFRKTASLFQTAAESGAILGGAPEEWVQALQKYGYNIGMAFQVVDDILDYEGDAEEVGKPVGNDLLQGVVTLPAIILTKRHPENNPIEQLFSDDDIKERLPQVLEMIHGERILDECHSVAESFCEKAANALDIVPDSAARHSLLELTRYVMERQR